MKKVRKKAAKAAKKKVTKKAAAKKAPAKKAATKKAKTTKAAKKTTKKRTVKKAPAVKRAAQPSVKKGTQKSAKKVAKKGTAKVARKQPPRKAAPRKKAEAQAASNSELPREITPATGPTAEATPVTIPAAPDDVLLTLAELLLNDPQYLDDVRVAVTAPDEYATTFVEELKLRGIEGTPPHLPWIALTEGLRQRDALVQLDAKFEPDDLSFALDTLLANHSAQAELANLPGYDDSAAALEAVGDRLLAAGLALVTVDHHEAKESFPVAVLAAEHVAAAQRLAATLGLGAIRRWSSEEAIE